MNNFNKGESPFYPGQPVPFEFFTGRMNQIQRIARALGQVELGKSQAIFLSGEYGIGKSSLANFMRYYGEEKNRILGIHAFLGGSKTVEEMAAKTVETVIKTHMYEPTFAKSIRNFLAKYLGQQELFGFFNINLEALKADAPNLSKGFLPFLHELLKRVEDYGVKGLMVILDEINGITRNPEFAHFIK